jgi:hypothetical protein
MERNSYWSSITESRYSENWLEFQTLRRRMMSIYAYRAIPPQFTIKDTLQHQYEVIY